MTHGPWDGPEWASWTFPADVDRIVDGDTVDVEADVGFRHRAHVRVRLRAVDTAEIYGVSHDSDEYATGQEHAEFVGEWVMDARDDASAADWPLLLATERESGKYGRWVGDLYRCMDDGTTQSLTDALVDEYPTVENAE